MSGTRSIWGVVRSSLSWLARLPVIRNVSKSFGRLLEAGTAGYDSETKRRLMIMNFIAYLVALTTLIYAIQQSMLDYEKFKPLVFLNLALVIAALAVPFAHRINEMAGGMIILVAEYFALFTFTRYLSHNNGVHLQYFIFAAATFVVFGLKRWQLIIPLIFIALGLHLYAEANFTPDKALIKVPPEMLWGIHVQASVTTMLLIAGCVFYAFRLVERAKGETDNLLRNILPDKIAERLKAAPNEIIADNFDDASILFADISGFVALARTMGAAQVVDMLNRIVSEFDSLATKHGVEKIKTIGDAYMVASGIPEPTDDHLQRLARMAGDMLKTLENVREETGLPLNMRVGIASGSVMAGVIGTRKFTYDVWGDPVNLAARLENKSRPGRILVCQNCHEKLKPHFDFESRGTIDIKGVGEQETWFLGREKNCSQTEDQHPQSNAIQTPAT